MVILGVVHNSIKNENKECSSLTKYEKLITNFPKEVSSTKTDRKS